MPSLFEPCGLSQLYALRYGTLPVVHATGGLEDTVEQYNEGEGTGTGFKFYAPEAARFLDAIRWAVETWYERPSHITMMREQAMHQRFEWEASARRYVEIYRRAMAKRGPERDEDGRHRAGGGGVAADGESQGLVARTRRRSAGGAAGRLAARGGCAAVAVVLGAEIETIRGELPSRIGHGGESALGAGAGDFVASRDRRLSGGGRILVSAGGCRGRETRNDPRDFGGGGAGTRRPSGARCIGAKKAICCGFRRRRGASC